MKTHVSSASASMGRVPAAASALSGLLFVALLGLLHVLEPAFDPRWRFVSEYALGRYGWLMSIAFVALAVSLAAGALAVRRDVHDWIGYLGLFGLARTPAWRPIRNWLFTANAVMLMALAIFMLTLPDGGRGRPDPSPQPRALRIADSRRLGRLSGELREK